MFDWIKKLFNIKKKKCSYELKKAILCSTIFSIGDNTKDEETFKSYFIFMCDQVMNNNLNCIANSNCINSKFENTVHILFHFLKYTKYELYFQI